jgi:hypothetical protein
VPTTKRFEGKTEEIKNDIDNTPDGRDADLFLKTTKAIVNCVHSHCHSFLVIIDPHLLLSLLLLFLLSFLDSSARTMSAHKNASVLCSPESVLETTKDQDLLKEKL